MKKNMVRHEKPSHSGALIAIVWASKGTQVSSGSWRILFIEGVEESSWIKCGSIVPSSRWIIRISFLRAISSMVKTRIWWIYKKMKGVPTAFNIHHQINNMSAVFNNFLLRQAVALGNFYKKLMLSWRFVVVNETTKNW